MKKAIIACLLTATIFSFTSCGTSSNLIFNQNQNQTSVVLSQNNFKVVGTAKGQVKSTYIFGLGGLSKKSLRENAMGAMIKSADLKDGAKAIINANVTEKNVFVLPFFYKRIMTAEGQIIEFTK